jgi:hypothetical protein
MSTIIPVDTPTEIGYYLNCQNVLHVLLAKAGGEVIITEEEWQAVITDTPRLAIRRTEEGSLHAILLTGSADLIDGVVYSQSVEEVLHEKDNQETNNDS